MLSRRASLSIPDALKVNSERTPDILSFCVWREGNKEHRCRLVAWHSSSKTSGRFVATRESEIAQKVRPINPENLHNHKIVGRKFSVLYIQAIFAPRNLPTLNLHVGCKNHVPMTEQVDPFEQPLKTVAQFCLKPSDCSARPIPYLESVTCISATLDVRLSVDQEIRLDARFELRQQSRDFRLSRLIKLYLSHPAQNRLDFTSKQIGLQPERCCSYQNDGSNEKQNK